MDQARSKKNWQLWISTQIQSFDSKGRSLGSIDPISKFWDP